MGRERFRESVVESNALKIQQISVKIRPCLTEFQKGLSAHCQQERWHLKWLFGRDKVLIQDSYVNLSIINPNEYQKKKKFENFSTTEAPTASRTHTIDEYLLSYEDLLVYKEPIALSDLFTKKSEEYGVPKRLIVFGRAGIGKSVLCQYLAVRWHQEVLGGVEKPLTQSEVIKSHAEKEQMTWLKNFKAVFWIRLREIPTLLKEPGNDGSLQNIINLCCYGGKKKESSLKHLLKEFQQESLFILDGYDEIEEALDKDNAVHNPALLAIWNVLKEQSNVILTSRPRNLDFLWPRDKTVRRLELAGFSHEQVENYIQNFMAEPLKHKDLSAKTFLNCLKSKPNIWEAAHIPINLEMLCWLYREGKLSNQANSLSILYEEIIEGIFSEISKKHRDINEWPKTVSPAVKNQPVKEIAIHFLEYLAYEGMLKNELLLSNQTIELSVKKVLKMHNIDDDKELTEKFINIGHQLGFLFSIGESRIPVAEQTHYFIHLCFQEHFASRYIASHLTIKEETKEKQEIIKQLQADRHNPRYQLIWRSTAGLLARQGEATNDYDALKIFSHAIFLSFLPQTHMNEVDFRLTTDCLDECIGINPDILSKLLLFSEYENLKEKMMNYFDYFVFYEDSKLREKTLEILERCPHFFSMRPFIDDLFFERLITFSKNENISFYTRRKVCEVLLRITEYTDEVTEMLLELAKNKNIGCGEKIQVLEILLKISVYARQAEQILAELSEDKNVGVRERRQALKILLKIPSYVEKSTKTLIVLAKDKNVDSCERIRVCEILLTIPEHANEAVEILNALTQDNNVDIEEKIQAMENLLRIPECAEQAIGVLTMFAKNKRLGAYQRRQAWEILLGVEEYAKQAAEALSALAKDKNVYAWQRMQAWKTLLKIPTHSEQAAAVLITFVQDKNVYTWQRMQAWEALLRTPTRVKQAIEVLTTFAQDKNTYIGQKIQAWEALLKTPAHAKQASEALIAVAKDNNTDNLSKKLAWEILLKIHEHANQAAIGLMIWVQDRNVDACERKRILEILLKIPGHANKASEMLIELKEKIEEEQVIFKLHQVKSKIQVKIENQGKVVAKSHFNRENANEKPTDMGGHNIPILTQYHQVANMAFKKNSNKLTWVLWPAMKGLFKTC